MARPEPGGQRYRGINLPLKTYIAAAYRMKPDQVTGAPGWFDADNFDIVAQAPKPATLDEMYAMLRNLLAERFHLQFHWDSKTLPVYVLSAGPSGTKLTRHDAGSSGEVSIEQSMEAPFHAKWKAEAASMEVLAFRLGLVMDRPVIDQTSLKGDYDFTLAYTMELPPNISPDAKINGQPIDTSGPSIFQAVRQQLGLALDARKAPVRVMVVDHAEKPSEN